MWPHEAAEAFKLARYAAYYLAHPVVRAYIVQHAIGATMPNLNKSILSGVPFLLPPVVDQLAISSMLGALDAKIDLNRRINKTLEAMARAIFRDWFVDFGPIRAKAEGREPYLAPELWDLFPNEIDEEDKPFGWLVCPACRFIGCSKRALPANPPDRSPD